MGLAAPGNRRSGVRLPERDPEHQLAAVGAGLFDAALNYLWDETIAEFRRRVARYDLEGDPVVSPDDVSPFTGLGLCWWRSTIISRSLERPERAVRDHAKSRSVITRIRVG